jgi:hypothetical protein
LELLVATGSTTTTEVTLPPSCCCTTLLLLNDATSGAAAGTASVAIPTTCSKFSQFLQESFANSATSNLFSETTKTPLLSSSCLSFFFFFSILFCHFHSFLQLQSSLQLLLSLLQL